MAWIKTVSVAEATGIVRAEYDAALARAGRVWHIIKMKSLNGPVMKHSTALYGALMHGPSPLTRAQREMLAVVVSKTNGCHYWTQAHAHDLRGEVDDSSLVEAVSNDWTQASLTETDRALLNFAVALTRTPSAMTRKDVADLRAVGLSDRAISDAVHIVSYFNYINRIADAVGVGDVPLAVEIQRRLG